MSSSEQPTTAIDKSYDPVKIFELIESACPAVKLKGYLTSNIMIQLFTICFFAGRIYQHKNPTIHPSEFVEPDVCVEKKV